MNKFFTALMAGLILIFATRIAPAASVNGDRIRTDCNTPAQNSDTRLTLPAHPFAAIPSSDGCFIFVSLSGQDPDDNTIAVVARSGGKLSILRSVKMATGPLGMVLTHDGQLLIAANGIGAAIFDTAALESGNGNALLGNLADGQQGAVYVNITADDSTLFVSDEGSATISVIDLKKARATGFAGASIVGQIPSGFAPIALTFSPDEKYLYTTSEVMLSQGAGWPAGCAQAMPSQAPNRSSPDGALIVVDVARARSDPANAVLSRTPAGCSPVRLTLSPDGARAYVTARGENALLTFDTAKLLSGGIAMPAKTQVGNLPVGVAVIDEGRKVIVTNSDRSSGCNVDQTLSVIDAGRIGGEDAVLGTVPAGIFPRELAATKDGKTLLVTNFGSNALQMIDLARLPLTGPTVASSLPIPKPHHEITLDAKAVTGYVGQYELAPGRMMTVTLDDGHLFAQPAGQQKHEIFAEGSHDFFLKDVDAQIHFDAAADGRATSLTVHQNCRDIVAKRVDAITPVLAHTVVPGLDGDWDGAITGPNGKTLRVTFHIETAANVTTATMYSVDQRNIPIPVASISHDGNVVTLTVPSLMGAYSAILDAGGKTMTGSWTQAGHSVALALTVRMPGEPAPIVSGGAEAVASVGPQISQKSNSDIAGQWQGTLQAGKGLRAVLKITKVGDGSWSGLFYSIDQVAIGIPVTSITLQDSTFKFSIDRIHGNYVGTLSADGASITGTWSQIKAVPLNFDRANKETAWAIPTRPAAPPVVPRTWPVETGTAVRFLTNDPNTMDVWPAFSPDGKKILFSRSVDGFKTFELFIVPATGGDAQKFASAPLPISATRVNWSTRSKLIAFTGSGADGSNVWIINPDGTNAHPLAPAGLSNQTAYPAWYPDGKRLAVMDGGDMVIKRFDLAPGATAVTVTNHTQVLTGMPSVSPDGKWIAFAGQKNTGQPYNQDINSIWLVGEDGISRTLEADPGQGRAPRWSPDGKRLGPVDKA